MSGMYRVALALSLVWPSGCGNGTVSGCKETSDCAAGSVCYNGACTPLCIGIDDCEPGKCCSDGVCGSCGDLGGAPQVSSINGTGTPDLTGGHASLRIRDRLMITGSNLADAEAVLFASNGTPSSLERCAPATATEMQVLLPSTVTAGSYVLVVQNQLGSCDASLTLLQGEPGLGGSTLAVTASTPALARSIIFGSELRSDATADSLFLVVVDAVTETVVDQGLAGGHTVGAYTAASVQTLTDVLLGLSTLPDPVALVVVIGSSGDVSAMAADPGLAAAIESVGGSSRFAGLRASEGYALVGSPGLGAGGGIEQVAGAARASIASVGTAIVDGVVIGFRTVAQSSGPPTDLECSGCVALGSETSGTYDTTADTIADDDVISSTEVDFNYAASASKGGAASDVACSGCVALGTDTSGTYDSTADTIADDDVISSTEVDFNYAASASKGGAASDVACSGCVALGTDTSGTYDSTADTIADDGVISDGEVSDAISINNGLLYAPTSGNVGIGTAAPGAKLDITDTSAGLRLRVGGGYTYLGASGTPSGGLLTPRCVCDTDATTEQCGGAGGSYTPWTDEGASCYDQTSGGSRLFTKQLGNQPMVGFGVNDDGTLFVRGIRLKLSAITGSEDVYTGTICCAADTCGNGAAAYTCLPEEARTCMDQVNVFGGYRTVTCRAFYTLEGF